MFFTKIWRKKVTYEYRTIYGNNILMFDAKFNKAITDGWIKDGNCFSVKDKYCCHMKRVVN